MVQRGTKIMLDVEGISSQGHGVGRGSGLVVFVEGGLSGDRLEVKIVRAKSRYAYGEILDVVRPSPHRVRVLCPVARRCGGCQWQHVEYGAQLEFKKQIVADALARIGGIKDAPVADAAGMEEPWGYRNKAVFAIGSDGVVGTYEARSHRVVQVDGCAIVHPVNVDILKIVKYYIQGQQWHGLKSLMVRAGFATGEVMAVLSADAHKLPGEAELARDLARVGVTTFLVNNRVVFGPGYFREKIGHVTYRLSAPSFLQVNTVQAKVLYDIALEQAGLNKEQTIVDAHCGVGGVGLYGADLVRHVVGIDVAETTIADAKINARLNNIENAEFICARAEDALPALLSQGQKPDVVFLDPPRRGCDIALLDALVTSGISKIVYISCDPATLARDVKILAAGGYRLADVRPVDMFPMTAGVETSCLLER